MRIFFSRISVLALLLGVCPWWASDLSAQQRRAIGLQFGQTQSRQNWSGRIGVDDATGLSLGMFVDVDTPLHRFSVRAEIGYLQRGSKLWDKTLDPDRLSASTVKSHYVSMPIHGKLEFGIGPVRPYLFGGPTFSLLLKTGCSEDFCVILGEGSPTEFGFGFGSGIGMNLGDRLRVDLELRLTEGLTDAYEGRSSGVSYRTTELAARISTLF